MAISIFIDYNRVANIIAAARKHKHSQALEAERAALQKPTSGVQAWSFLLSRVFIAEMSLLSLS